MTVYTDTRTVPAELRERAQRAGLLRDHIGWGIPNSLVRVVAHNNDGRWWWCEDDGASLITSPKYVRDEAQGLTIYLDWVEGRHEAHLEAWAIWRRVAPLFDALLDLDSTDAEWLIERYRSQVESVFHVDLSRDKPHIMLTVESDLDASASSVGRITVRRAERFERHRWGPARDGGVRVCERCGRVRFPGSLIGLSPRTRYVASMDDLRERSVSASRRAAGSCVQVLE